MRRTSTLLLATVLCVLAGGLGSGAAPAAAAGTVTAITAGTEDTCAIRDGAAWCWGYGESGALGNGTTTTTDLTQAVTGMTGGVTSISAGLDVTCAVKDGGAWCWGDNSAGQLGNNSTTDSLVPVAVSGMSTGVTAVSAGSDHACAIKLGAVWCWGANDVGELGNNSTNPSLVPVAVSNMTSGVTALSAGIAHTCAIKSGAAWCWGLNAAGELGNGAAECDGIVIQCWSTVPVAAVGLTTGVTAIAAGDEHSCAVKSAAAWCWGSNENGQLGVGTNIVPICTGAVTNCWTSTPRALSSMTSGVTAISAGSEHTCAVKSGAALCWGLNFHAQLGSGSSDGPEDCDGFACSTTPVAVVGLTAGVTAIAAGYDHSCAVKDGSAWCWGSALSSELGAGAVEHYEFCQVDDACSSTPLAVVFYLPTALDVDGDGIANAADNCPEDFNAKQLNTDAANTAAHHGGADGLGDACDQDIDGDGYSNAVEMTYSIVTWEYCGIMRADVDGDGRVGVLDLAVVGQYFLLHVTAASVRSDQDGDGVIGILDLATISAVSLRHANECGAPD